MAPMNKWMQTWSTTMLKRWVEEWGPKLFSINLFLVHVGAVTSPIIRLFAACPRHLRYRLQDRCRLLGKHARA